MNKSNLKPARVFEQFAKINQIPRPSKREEKMIAYLEEFGKSRQLETLVDDTGNVIIRKKATPGYETRKTVILQSHMDMVCEKLVDVDFDFDNDAIQTYVDGDWLAARGTTLGADNGHPELDVRHPHQIVNLAKRQLRRQPCPFDAHVTERL